MINVSIMEIFLIFISIVLLVIGIQYVLKKGYSYEKALESATDEAILKIGIVLIVVSSVILAFVFYRIFLWG